MKRALTVASNLALAAAVLALPTMSKPFNDLYRPGKASALGKAGCVVCHTGLPAKALNPYGKDLAAALKKAGTKTLTAKILKSIEALDSDKDRAKNGDELKKGTLPGDAKSKP